MCVCVCVCVYIYIYTYITAIVNFVFSVRSNNETCQFSIAMNYHKLMNVTENISNSRHCLQGCRHMTVAWKHDQDLRCPYARSINRRTDCTGSNSAMHTEVKCFPLLAPSAFLFKRKKMWSNTVWSGRVYCTVFLEQCYRRGIFAMFMHIGNCIYVWWFIAGTCRRVVFMDNLQFYCVRLLVYITL